MRVSGGPVLQQGEGERVAIQFVDVGMKYPVRKTNTGALVWVLLGQLDVNLPSSAFEGCCSRQQASALIGKTPRTVLGSLKLHVEFLPVICEHHGAEMLYCEEKVETDTKDVVSRGISGRNGRITYCCHLSASCHNVHPAACPG